MSKTKNFSTYFDHLIEYQAELPSNKLNTDYIILYDYLMDLLEKDDVIGELLVRKKQQMPNVNADILLDLTKLFDARSYIYEPFLCLTLAGRDNKGFEENLHPFCNEKLSILPRNIKKQIWLALSKGILTNGSFVRGYQGDIYEMNLSPNDPNDCCIRMSAYSDGINININLRVLVKYSKNLYSEPSSTKPFPKKELNKEWLAKLSSNSNSPFDICLPKLECEMKHRCFVLVTILRFLKVFFKNRKQLCILDGGFVESIIYSEFTDRHASKKSAKQSNDYIFMGVLTHIRNALKTRKCSCFWNERLNLIKCFEDDILLSRASDMFNKVYENINKLRSKDVLKYEEFFEFFDFKMETCSYEVDQFGIFKSY